MNRSTRSSSPKWIAFLNRSSAQIIIETCAFVLIGVTAISGNLLVIASIWRNRALRTCTNYLALSLSVADILYPLTILPLTIFWLIDIQIKDFEYSNEFCEFQAICLLSLTNVSGYTISLMAFNRFICVCKSQRYKRMFKKKTTLLMIGGVWIACFAVGIPIVKGELYFAKFSPQTVMCMFSRKTRTTVTKISGHSLLAVSIAVPYAIIMYCYFMVFKKIRQHKRTIGHPSSNSNTLGVQEIKITWTLFAVLLGYLVAWIPVLVVGVLSSYNKSLPHHVTIILPFSIASNCAINPLIYGVMNPAFRREYIEILSSFIHRIHK